MIGLPHSIVYVVEPKPDLIWKMLGRHERLFENCCIDDLSRLPKGWHPLIANLADIVEEYTRTNKFPGFRFNSVKEWNGELFIDQQCDDERLTAAINITKHVSKTTCQICGEIGQEVQVLKKRFVLCPTHEIAKVAQIEDEE